MFMKKITCCVETQLRHDSDKNKYNVFSRHRKDYFVSDRIQQLQFLAQRVKLLFFLAIFSYKTLK